MQVMQDHDMIFMRGGGKDSVGRRFISGGRGCHYDNRDGGHGRGEDDGRVGREDDGGIGKLVLEHGVMGN